MWRFPLTAHVAVVVVLLELTCSGCCCRAFPLQNFNAASATQPTQSRLAFTSSSSSSSSSSQQQQQQQQQQQRRERKQQQRSASFFVLQQAAAAGGRGGGGTAAGGAISASSSLQDSPPPLRRNPPRRVALMVEPTPFTHVSGYANRFQEMLKFMKKAGDHVDILTVDTHTPAKDLPVEHLGYPVRHTQGFTFPLYNQISLTLDLPQMKGARMIEKFKPDLIHVTSPGFLLFAAIFYARVMCIPLVMSYHTHLPSYGKNYARFVPGVENICWELLRYAHSRADLTLVTSPQMKAELERNGIPRVQVWRKGIDTDRFHYQFRSHSMRNKMTNGNPDDFLMVYVGRLGAEKRLKDCKAILENMQQPGSRLCIVGTGPQADELKEWFHGTNTVFMGQLQGDDLSQAFASADAFVMPSDSETLGFVVLESMASGVPVVGAAAGGIPDLIHHGKDGYLAEPGNTQEFVHYLSLLRDNAKLLRQRMGKAARAEAERWGWEAATSYLRNVQYERALINFHSRAFGGFGRPRSAGMWRLAGWRIRRILQKLKSSNNNRGIAVTASTTTNNTNNAMATRTTTVVDTITSCWQTVRKVFHLPPVWENVRRRRRARWLWRQQQQQQQQ